MIGHGKASRTPTPRFFSLKAQLEPPSARDVAHTLDHLTDRPFCPLSSCSDHHRSDLDQPSVWPRYLGSTPSSSSNTGEDRQTTPSRVWNLCTIIRTTRAPQTSRAISHEGEAFRVSRMYKMFRSTRSSVEAPAEASHDNYAILSATRKTRELQRDWSQWSWWPSAQELHCQWPGRNTRRQRT